MRSFFLRLRDAARRRSTGRRDRGNAEAPHRDQARRNRCDVFPGPASQEISLSETPADRSREAPPVILLPGTQRSSHRQNPLSGSPRGPVSPGKTASLHSGLRGRFQRERCELIWGLILALDFSVRDNKKSNQGQTRRTPPTRELNVECFRGYRQRFRDRD
jgi:hypothetical protein